MAWGDSEGNSGAQPGGGDTTTQLIDLARGRRVVLPGYFPTPVRIEDATALDAQLLFLRVRTPQGLKEVTISSSQLEKALASAPSLATPIVSAEDFFLLVESARIRLAYAYDPYFAVNLTGIQVLPHQLEAVYERMLPQVSLRFLLADDPGAGKTIMAGLLIKELRLRSIVERVLVLCPAPLTIQWQDELRTKFDERFVIMSSDYLHNVPAGNPWDDHSLCIASIDLAKREELRDEVLEAPWDLVVIDEAHKCSARTDGDKVSRTKRYELAERLSRVAERVLLMTATPHQGNADQFAHFLRLLDEDQFVDLGEDKKLIQLEGSPWYLRRMKEDMRDMDGNLLFTKRHAVTQPFVLTDPELELYRQVTEYINSFLPKQAGRKRTSVALARVVLQRRLASSLGAICSSLVRRRDRFKTILGEVDGLPPSERDKVLARYRLIDLDTVDAEQESDDQEEAQEDILVDSTLVAERVDQLRDEVRELERLTKLAHETRDRGEEAKLAALRQCLTLGEFAELQDGRGKLLIFTEHRDTLEYLKRNLEEWGYLATSIHGGMGARERKDRQIEFQRDKQICIATEAAGEGINLQFCHLMINYDLPWNPNRLEQRMGRIHRIGQRYDVYVFNFVAANTIEGAILERLLIKLEEIRKSLGDRVYDVIGELLKLSDVNLEDLLREAAYNPKQKDDYLDEIERIDPDRLREYEAAVGIALAKSQVDLTKVRGQDWRSEERRLMPEYVEQFFIAAATRTGLTVQSRADGLWRVEHVQQQFRADSLTSVHRTGRPEQRYPKFTFKKEILQQDQHLDGELVSPGHPLFAAVDEVLNSNVEACREGVARFLDPFSASAYRLHFFVVGIEGGTANEAQFKPAAARLIAVAESGDGGLEVAAPDILHDLTPTSASGEIEMDPDRIEEVRRFAMARVQHGMAEEVRVERLTEVAIRRDYLREAFAASVRKARERWMALAGRVARGEDAARLARDEAMKRAEELERRRDEKLRELSSLEIVRNGAVAYLGSAVVEPTDAPGAQGMQRDPEVEAAAMTVAMSHEEAEGWQPTDVSRLGDGSGFDIRSVGPPDELGRRPVRRIEVKGRAEGDREVELTPNEWVQAGRHRKTYWLYVVWNARTNPELLRVNDPVGTIGDEVRALHEVRGYRVPATAIRRGATE
jgi:superfamily II DNA or RNA helicase